MSEVIHETTANEANTYKKELSSVYKKTELDLKVLQEGISESDRIGHMKNVFKKIQEKGGKMSIVEENATDEDKKTDVVFRQMDANGKLSGKTGVRLAHGTEVALENGGKYVIATDANGEKHVYIKVNYNGKTGYIASEHLDVDIDMGKEEETEAASTTIPKEKVQTAQEAASTTVPKEKTQTAQEAASTTVPKEKTQTAQEAATTTAPKDKATVAQENQSSQSARTRIPPLSTEKTNNAEPYPYTDKKKALIAAVGGPDEMTKILEKGEEEGLKELYKKLSESSDKDSWLLNIPGVPQVYIKDKQKLSGEDVFKWILAGYMSEGNKIPEYLGGNAEKSAPAPAPAPEKTTLAPTPSSSTEKLPDSHSGFKDLVESGRNYSPNLIAIINTNKDTKEESKLKLKDGDSTIRLDELEFKKSTGYTAIVGKIYMTIPYESGDKEVGLKHIEEGVDKKSITFIDSDNKKYEFTLSE